MTGKDGASSLSGERAKTALLEGLRAGLPELEAEVLDAEPSRELVADGGALIAATRLEVVRATLADWLQAIEEGGAWSGPVSPSVVVQARRAARRGIGSGRLIAVHSEEQRLAWAYLLSEVSNVAAGSRQSVLEQAWTATSSLQRELLLAVAEAHAEELASESQSRDRSLVLALLAGREVDAARLHYDVHGRHLGVVVSGSEALDAANALVRALDRQALIVEGDGQDTAWCWLDGNDAMRREAIEDAVPDGRHSHIRFAFGSLGSGVRAFRQTHEMALLADMAARDGRSRVTWYVDVAFEAEALRHPAMAASLISAYIDPVLAHRDGEMLLQTLKAYYSAHRNESKAAKRIRVSRNTLRDRLRRIEEPDILGRPLYACHAELEVALRYRSSGCQSASI